MPTGEGIWLRSIEEEIYMMRRITAALLALIILLSAVPMTRANAEEIVYKKGQELRIPVENVTMPYDPSRVYPTAYGYKWDVQLDKYGNYKMECTRPEHSCDPNVCFDDDGYRTENCTGAHNHQTNSRECIMGYVWKVVRDPEYILWYDDPLAPENYELAVCCFEPDGIVPMAGVGLRLFRVTDKEIQKEDGSTEVRTINDSILLVDPEEPSGTQNPVTNKNGYYYFTGECKESIPAGDHTWYLIQMPEEFREEGKYYNQYRSNSVKWEVDVHVNGDGTYAVNDIRDPNGISLLSEEEEDEYPKPVEGYDKDNKRLVILNRPINVIINIDLIDVPKSLEQLDATIMGPNGFEQQIQITKNSGRWHFKSTEDELLKDVTLESGEYTVEAITGNYPVVYMVNRSGEEPVEGNTLTLDRDHQNGFYEIHFVSLSNTVKLYAVDEKDKPAPGAVYGLFNEAGEKIADIDSEGDSTAVIDINKWKELDTGACTLTVKQIEAPENHDLDAETVYKIIVTETGDELEPYSVEMILAEGSEKVRYNEQKEQIGTFRNRKHDLSYKIIPRSLDQESEETITAGEDYRLTNVAIPEDIFGIESDEILDMKEFMASAYEPGWEKMEFSLTQRTAPEGYDLSEDSYTVTVTEGENGAVTVEVTKDANVFKRIAMFFTGDGIGRGDFGEWKPVFTNVKRAIPHNNTVILRAVDGEGKGVTGAEYEIYMDGESIGVKLPGTFNDGELSITENKGKITVDSNGWMAIGMKLYMASLNENNDELKEQLKGDGVEVILKQIKTPAEHEPAGEEYPVLIRMAREEDGIADQFFIKLKDAANGTAVQYESDGTQIATFINEEKKEDVAYVSLTLNAMDESNYQWNECVEDSQFQNMYYEFGLYWDDPDRPVDFVALKPGETAIFDCKIPLGQAYTVKPRSVVPPVYNLVFTNTVNGETANEAYTGESQVPETVALTADISYEFRPGSSDIDAEIIVCDAKDIGITLEGAEFVLMDGPDSPMQDYYFKTSADGKISITGLKKVPAVYMLVQTKAPDGYAPMANGIPIEVKYNYFSEEGENGKIIAVQNLVVEAPTYIMNPKVNESSGMAKIHLSLDDIKIQWNDSESDKDQRAYYNDRDYEFLLYWKDNAGKWQTDNKVLTLVNNNKSRAGTFEKELPVGTAFKVCPAAEKVDYNITFSGGPAKDQTKAYEAIVEQAGNIHLNAQIKYVMAMGDFSPSLHMIKVYARDTSKTLAGAKFTLKDEDADALETYKTGKDGILEITFGMLEDYPATYTLKENKAPDDYLKLKSVIHINVGYKYTAENEGGTVVVYQDLVATADHPDVTLGRDGWYYIKNTHKNDNPKTGDSFNAAAWMGALLVSGAALSYVLMTEAKKRSVR